MEYLNFEMSKTNKEEIMSDIFTSEIEDVDLPALFQEVTELGDRLQNLGNSSDSVISVALSEYNKKFGTDLTITSLTDVLVDATQMSEGDVKSLELISKDLSYKISLIMKTKAIVVNAKLIDRALELVTTEMNSLVLGEVLIGMISQIFGWIDTLNTLMDENKVNGFESHLKHIAEKNKPVVDEMSSEAVSQLLSLLRK